MNKYQLNAPLHATHYTLKNDVATYYHFDNAVFVYQFSGWIEVAEPTMIAELIEL